jgi:hypothetical protein
LLGQRGTARLAGRRAALAGGDRGALAADGGRRGSDVTLDLQLGTTRDSTLAVTGYYAARQGSLIRTVPTGSQGAERSWGWDACWSASVGPASRFDVRVEFDDSQRTAATRDSEIRRTASAGGRFEHAPGGGHQYTVDLRAGVRARAASAAGGPHAGAPPVLGGDALFSVNLRGEDFWSLSTRGGVIHGFGVLHVDTTSGAVPIVAPRLGGFWRAGQVALRGAATWFGEIGGRAQASAAPLLDASLGYAAQGELALPSNVALSFGYSTTPLLLAEVAPDGEAAGGGTFASDGVASRVERTVTLTRATPRWILNAKHAAGTVAGNVAASPFLAGPVSVLAPGTVEYRTTGIGVRVPRAGTELAVDYRASSASQAPSRATETSLV